MNSIHLNPEIMTLPLNSILRIHTLTYVFPEELHVPHTCELHVPEKRRRVLMMPGCEQVVGGRGWKLA